MIDHTHATDLDSLLDQVAALGMQASEALQHAHEQGVVHRDVKPGNLMLDMSGNLWITDFGLARIEADPGVTMTGDLVGTLRYMNPEQALGKRIVVDNRADIYSLAATLYELVTLRPIFDGRNRQELLRQIAFDEPRPPRHLDRQIPCELETILLTALAKDPVERYASAQQLADDLRRYLADQPIQARPPSLLQRTAKWARCHKPLVASSAAMLLLVTVNLAISNLMIARERRIAQESFQLARNSVYQYLTAVSENQLLDTPGLQPLRKELLRLALEYYQPFIAERANDPTLQADLAAAYARVGKITSEIGSKEEALRAHRKAREILESLVNQHPEALDYRAQLAESYMYLGAWQRDLGRTAVLQCRRPNHTLM